MSKKEIIKNDKDKENIDIIENEDNRVNSENEENKANKKNKVAIIVSSAIATALIMTFFMFLGALFRNIYEGYGGIYGPFHIEATVYDKEVCKEIDKDILVRDTAYIPVKDYPLCNGKSIKHERACAEGFSVGTLTKDTLKLYYVDIDEGRMPKNNKEIILSNFYDFRENGIKLGDKVELENKKETVTYTVVGFYIDEFNGSQWAEFEAGCGIYSALTFDTKVKYTDKGTMYIRYYDLINIDYYERLDKLGAGEVRSNFYYNELLDVEEVWNHHANGKETYITLLSVLLILCIIASVIVRTGLKKTIKNAETIVEIGEYKKTEGKLTKEEKSKIKEVKNHINKQINKPIFIGMGIGIVIAYILQMLIALICTPYILKNVYSIYSVKFYFPLGMWLISLPIIYIVIYFSKNKSIKKLCNKLFVSRKKLLLNLKISVTGLCVVIIVVTVIVSLKLRSDYKIQLQNDKDFVGAGDLGYDLRVNDEVFYDESIPDEEFEVNKKALKEQYLSFTNDIKRLEDVEVVKMAIRGTKKVTIKQYNKELLQVYKNTSMELDGLKYTITLNELYLDDEHYKELIKKHKFNEEKYIGVKNPPAIVLNVRRIDDFVNTDMKGKILNQGEKTLVTTDKEKIIIGDLVNTYEKKLDPIDDSYDGYEKIYIVYPERCMQDITTYTVDIYANDYKKIENDIEILEKKHDSGNIMFDTPTKNVNKYIEEYEYKVSNLNSITLAIYVVAAGVILITLLKKVKK